MVRLTVVGNSMEAETICGLLRTEGWPAVTARRTWVQVPATL